jgi:hypothetical protein
MFTIYSLKSKIGLILVSLQLLTAFIVFLYYFSSDTEEAVWGLVIPILPVMVVFPPIDYVLNDSWTMYPVALVLSTSIVYIGGWLLEFLTKRIKHLFVS